MRNLKVSALLKGIAGRACNPSHLFHALSLQRNRKKIPRGVDDAQLKLYAEMLPREFLHYAYFDDVNTAPEDLSLNRIMDAQHRYAEVVLEQVVDRDRPVLDIGCGMGALSAMLRQRGFSPTALSPDRNQISHIQNKYPDIPAVQCKFEDLPVPQHMNGFGTLLNSESLQYIKLDRGLPVVDKILQPGGRWVICDYAFRPSREEKSCGQWSRFDEMMQQRGWKILHTRDITPHILPTLKFIHMLATRFGIPLMKFSQQKMKRKQPGLHYLLEGAFQTLDSFAGDQIKTITPEAFAQSHQYRLAVLEKPQ